MSKIEPRQYCIHSQGMSRKIHSSLKKLSDVNGKLRIVWHIKLIKTE